MIVKLLLAAHVMFAVTVQGPEPLMPAKVAAEHPLTPDGATAIDPAWQLFTAASHGCVHPAGIVRATWDPELNAPAEGAVKVNVKLFPFVPATAVVGLTVIVPEPSAMLTTCD